MSAQSQALPSTSPANAGMAVSQFENPMGIDGFEFVEFAAPAGQAQQLHDYFRKLGFVGTVVLSKYVMRRDIVE